MLAVFMAISDVFIDSGFSNALIRKTDRTDIDFSTVFFFNIFVGIFFYFLLFFISPCIARFYNSPILKDITKIIALNLLFNSLAVVQRAKLIIAVDFKKQTKISLIAIIPSSLCGFIMAYNGFGVWALVFQSMFNSGLNMFFLWIFVRWKPLKTFSIHSFKGLFSFGSKLLISGLIDTLYRNVYTIVIGKKFSAKDLGYYTRADQFAQFPSSNFTGIFQRVIFPILSGIQNDNEKLREIYRKYLRMLAFIIFPLMFGLAAVAKPLILLILTEKWSGIVVLLQILCFSYMWYPIHSINLSLLQIKGRSDLFLRLEIIKKCIGISILFITIPIGITAMCVGTIVSGFFGLIVNTYYTGKIISVGFTKQMNDLMPIFFRSFSMGVFSYFISSLFRNNLFAILCGTITGIIYYFLINIILGSKEFTSLIEMIKKRGLIA
jgi:O-antigen/teichoic acid export membrane protein